MPLTDSASRPPLGRSSTHPLITLSRPSLKLPYSLNIADYGTLFFEPFIDPAYQNPLLKLLFLKPFINPPLLEPFIKVNCLKLYWLSPFLNPILNPFSMLFWTPNEPYLIPFTTPFLNYFWTLFPILFCLSVPFSFYTLFLTLSELLCTLLNPLWTLSEPGRSSQAVRGECVDEFLLCFYASFVFAFFMRLFPFFFIYFFLSLILLSLSFLTLACRKKGDERESDNRKKRCKTRNENDRKNDAAKWQQTLTGRAERWRRPRDIVY